MLKEDKSISDLDIYLDNYQVQEKERIKAEQEFRQKREEEQKRQDHNYFITRLADELKDPFLHALHLYTAPLATETSFEYKDVRVRISLKTIYDHNSQDAINMVWETYWEYRLGYWLPTTEILDMTRGMLQQGLIDQLLKIKSMRQDATI